MADSFTSFAIRVTPIIPALMPDKALKLGPPVTMGRRSETVSRTAASVAAAGETTRTTTVAARPQQEGAAAATTRVWVPHVPLQGHGQARSESRPVGDHGAAVAADDDDESPPGGANRGGDPGHPPSVR
jgi:hypothetical protein